MMYPIEPSIHTGARYVEYPLPASVDDDGLMMTEWRMTEDEYHRLMCGGHVRIWVYTNDYSRPIYAEILEPENVIKES